MIDTDKTQDLAFFRGSRSTEYLGTANLGDLNGRHAHAPGCTMNEHALAALQASKVDEGVVGGEESSRDRCGCLEAQLLRNLRDRDDRGGHEAGETSRRKSKHPITDGKPVDARTD